MRSTLEGGAVDGFCVECGDDQRHDSFRHFGVAAGEDVHGGVTMFRPCVNGDMALRDDDDAAHPLRGKVMEVG